MKKISFLLASALLGAGFSFACSSDDTQDECSAEKFTPADGGAGGEGGAPAAMCEAPEAPAETIEIVGKYTDNFGSQQTITANSWNSTKLSLVNNEENYAIGRNDEAADYNACMWSKYVWVEEAGKLYYCQAPFAAESECAAEEAQDADTSDLAEGCNGFAWSELIAD